MKAAFATRASRWLPLVLTVVLGLSASAAGALLFYDGESERLYLSLDHRAGWRAKDLEVKLRMTGGPVGGFATFISTELTEGVAPDPEKFARWAQIRSNYIETVPRAYFWWPYLPGRDAGAPATSGISGDPGFQVPLRYLPGETDSRPGGLDPDEGVQATMRETLVRAWFGGGVRLSRPYRGRDGAGEEVTEVLFAAPVYEGGKVPPTIGDRQAKIAGIVGGAFSLRDMLDKAIKGTPATTEAIYIAEQPWSRDEPGQYFARYDPAVGHFLMEKGTVRPGDLAGLAIAKPLQGPGIDFYLLFEYLPAEIRSNRTPGPWLFLFSGLALTSAAAGYVQRSLRRRDALTAAVSVSDARLRRTHRELEAVVQSSPAAIVCTDRRGVVTVWNMAAEQLFGIPALDAVGSAYRPSPASSDTDMSDLGRAIAEGRLIDGTASLVTADGSRRDVSVRSASLTGETGELPGMIYMASDVTDMLLLEDQLRQAQKMEAVGQLTGGVAHDFNNLLAVIIGNLDLVGSAFDAGSRNAKLLDGALRAALRGADLTRALLAFARRQPLEPAPVDINQFIDNVGELLEHSLGEAIIVSKELQPDLWPVNIDVVQLESAITNLAINARDAMPTGGRLLIQTRNTHLDTDYAMREPGLQAGDYVVVEVTDNGHGMAPEVLAHAAEPFFTTKGEGKGVGLGLAMVYGFVKQSAGHMKIYSEAGRGTTIRLYLPRLGSRSRDVGIPPPLPSAVQAHETVLVVEDNPEIRRLVVSQLQGLGYQVIEAADGAQALEIASGPGRIDLVFSDMVMNGPLTGLDLVRELHRRCPKLKLLLTSGFSEAMSVKEREIEPGFIVPILTKPYRRDELARQLRLVLDQAT